MLNALSEKRWGEKTAVAYRRLPDIVAAFPTAFYIGLHRPLREVAESYAQHNPSWGPAGAVQHWLDFHRAITRCGDSLHYLGVDYTRLVEDPESVLREVCIFIGEVFSPAMLAHHRTARAQKLAMSPEFAAVSQPVFRRTRNGTSGALPTWLVSRATDYAPRLLQTKRDIRQPFWLPVLWVFVQARVVFREITAIGVSGA